MYDVNIDDSTSSVGDWSSDSAPWTQSDSVRAYSPACDYSDFPHYLYKNDECSSCQSMRARIKAIEIRLTLLEARIAKLE